MKNTTSFTRGFGLLESFLSKKRADKANELIPHSYRQGKILDIGCGTYPYFLMSTEFNDKYGIDPSLENTNIKGVNLRSIDISSSRLPFDSEIFDVITMLAVFEHLENENLEQVLKEIKRVLKNSGKLIITTPAPWSDKLLHFMATIGLISKEEIHEHKHNHSKEKIEDILNKAGFVEKNMKSGYFELGMNMWFTVTK